MAGKQKLKDISEDEVSDCISEKIDEGWDQDRAVAACLNMAREGSSEPEEINQQYEVNGEEITITPPDKMVNAAEAAQEAQENGVIPGECGTGTGDRRADQITNDEVGPDVVAEIASYLTSHEEDVTAEGSPTDWSEEEWSDCGNAQYAKWGGSADGDMMVWAQEKANEVAEARDEELPYPERIQKQADFQFEVGDWVQWEFADGTSQGRITDRENEPGESLSAQGNEREATEEEPVYKMDEWDEEEGELTNDVVKSESELTEIERPAEFETDAMNDSKSESFKEIKQRIENQKSKQDEKSYASFRVKGSDIDLKETDSNGDIIAHVPIQSLSEDRDGDVINEQGQESIIRQLQSGTVPLMLNHGIGSSAAMYDARDIIGQFVNGENRNGTTVGTVRMRKKKDSDELHEDAKEVVDLLEQDMPIGFSVGFRVLNAHEREKEDGEVGMEISKVDLMEVSAVGIPSNPDAVPQAMGSAVAMAKNAGISKQEIMSSIEKAFNDTMSENTEQKEDSTDENETSKSEELKQITQDELDAVLGAVGGAIDAHMDAAMQDIEDELESMVEQTEEMDDDDDMEEEGTHDDEDEEEMSQDSADTDEETEGKDSSGHEDDEDKKSESSEPEVPKTAEKNKKKGGKIKTQEDKDAEDEEEKQTDQIAEISADKGEFW